MMCIFFYLRRTMLVHQKMICPIQSYSIVLRTSYDVFFAKVIGSCLLSGYR